MFEGSEIEETEEDGIALLGIDSLFVSAHPTTRETLI